MSYPVGTICVGQNFEVRTELNGEVCAVVKPCHLRAFVDSDETFAAYIVQWPSGEELVVYPHQLRLKRHDDEDKEARSRVRDRQKVSKLIAACKKAAESAIEAGEKVDQEEGAE